MHNFQKSLMPKINLDRDTILVYFFSNIYKDLTKITMGMKKVLISLISLVSLLGLTLLSLLLNTRRPSFLGNP